MSTVNQLLLFAIRIFNIFKTGQLIVFFFFFFFVFSQSSIQ